MKIALSDNGSGSQATNFLLIMAIGSSSLVTKQQCNLVDGENAVQHSEFLICTGNNAYYVVPENQLSDVEKSELITN